MNGPIERTTFPFPRELEFSEVIDVRSPAEFAEDGIPGAISLPVLDNEERVRVGVIFKQVSAFEARKLGAALISKNIAEQLETHFAPMGKEYRPLIYCWRGGQRSHALATVLSQIGWQVWLLEGGYRTYRRHVTSSLSAWSASLPFVVINGLTGSGKTRVIGELGRRGEQVLDLEALASHKGSVFGGDPRRPQPPQKRFESALCEKLSGFDAARPVFIEAESAKIGKLNIPNPLWQKMKVSPVIELYASVRSRSQFLLREYGDWLADEPRVIRTIERLRSFHAAKSIAEWEEMARAGRWSELISALLTEHYDRRYRPDDKRGAFQKASFRIDSEIDEEAAAASIATEIQEFVGRSSSLFAKSPFTT